jgi:hypothetical protein
MVARLDDFDGFLSRDGLILFSHDYELLFTKLKKPTAAVTAAGQQHEIKKWF